MGRTTTTWQVVLTFMAASAPDDNPSARGFNSTLMARGRNHQQSQAPARHVASSLSEILSGVGLIFYKGCEGSHAFSAGRASVPCTERFELYGVCSLFWVMRQ
ncbi:MAG TPA: hypothetical protein VKP30_25915 [Polyangiaceae bacterium]|nr:hypothetical protein [Polyangiaceae bacterium]